MKRGRAVSLALLVAAACGGPQKLGGSGATCFRDDDCEAGMICVAPTTDDIHRVCSTDPTPLISMVAGPPPVAAGGTAAGAAGMAGMAGVAGTASGGAAGMNAGGNTSAGQAGKGGAAGSSSGGGSTAGTDIGGGAGTETAGTSSAGTAPEGGAPL